MKIKPLYIAAGIAGLLSLTSSAHAALITPSVKIGIAAWEENLDGTEVMGAYKSYDFSGGLVWTPSATNPDAYDLTAGKTFWRTVDTDGTQAQINLNSLGYDKDPQLNFTITATNNTTKTQTYSFAYNTPLDPNFTGTINSYAELKGTLTDGGSAGALVKPLNGHFLLESFDLDTDGNQISKNVDIGTAFSTVNVMQPFAQNGTLVCGTLCETMSAVLTFTLSKGDSVTFIGKVEQLTAVPIPGAVWLFGSALAGLMGSRRKQQSAYNDISFS